MIITINYNDQENNNNNIVYKKDGLIIYKARFENVDYDQDNCRLIFHTIDKKKIYIYLKVYNNRLYTWHEIILYKLGVRSYEYDDGKIYIYIPKLKSKNNFIYYAKYYGKNQSEEGKFLYVKEIGTDEEQVIKKYIESCKNEIVWRFGAIIEEENKNTIDLEEDEEDENSLSIIDDDDNLPF